MSNATEKPKTERKGGGAGMIVTVVLVAGLMITSIALGVTSLSRADARAKAIADGAYADIKPHAAMRAEQQGALEAAPAWEDKDEGTVTIPVGMAKELVVAEIAANPNAATQGQPPAPDAGADAGDAGADGSASEGGAAEEAASGAAPAPSGGEEPAPGEKAPAPEKPAPAP